LKGIQIFKILGVLITLLVCVSGSYATNPEAVNTTDNQQVDQLSTDLGYIADDSGADDSGVDDSGVDDSGVDDSGVDDSGVDDSGVDDSGVDDSYTIEPVYMPINGVYRSLILEKFAADDSGSDDSNNDDSRSDDNPNDIYYTLATSELSDGNTPLAAGSDEIDDSGSDDSDNGSGDVSGNGGIGDGSSDDNGSSDTGIDDGSLDDNGTDVYPVIAEQDPTSGSDSDWGYGNNGIHKGNSKNIALNSSNSIPMQHTGLPILPALLGVLSLMGGFVINKTRS